MDMSGSNADAARMELARVQESLLKSQKEGDNEGEDENEDLEFIYDDADSYTQEIAELYSYTEEAEFSLNKQFFEEAQKSCNSEGAWLHQETHVRRRLVLYLCEQLELRERAARLSAARAVLYLVQGNFGECSSVEQQQQVCRSNVVLLYESGGLTLFMQLLAMEIENPDAVAAVMKKSAVSIVDSEELRVILNVLYSMVEAVRLPHAGESEELRSCRQSMRAELAVPQHPGDELLVIILLNMVTQFCSSHAPHFPMRKVLLLLWKTLLFTLGGLSDFTSRKNERREAAGLPVLDEDPMLVISRMRASSPPATAAEMIEAQQLQRSRPRGASNPPPSTGVFSRKPGLLKQAGVIDYDRDNDDQVAEDEGLPPTPPRPSTPVHHEQINPLPWKPKVRTKDLEQFLSHARQKFVHFDVKNDTVSLAGLPPSIKESVAIIKRYIYTSLAEIQVNEEEELAKNPLSKVEVEPEQTPIELLYRGMFTNLPQYMIALLKTLLAAAPTSKPKADSINILSDVLPEHMPTTVLQSMKLGVDVNRHQEVIVKAISGTILLLLKHFKLNHVYQFEFMSQHLVFANCIPLVLKFFNHNILAYVSAKNGITVLDFPRCVIGEQPELTAESLESGDAKGVCWRNMFACVNLLRILSKLTKWKHSRTMMLVVFKSAPILKRALRVRHALLQLYVYKLLKLQTKYLGRQWRKSNMRTLSGIYQKVRHRLNDDWAFGNDMDARPWDFQAEECALRACVDRFNNRRYGNGCVDAEFRPVDNCLASVMAQEISLAPEFASNYEQWLENEVLGSTIDWDQILEQ